MIADFREELAATKVQDNPTPGKNAKADDKSERYLNVARSNPAR